MFRFTGEEQVATPYVGGGFSIAGHDGCGVDPDCPDLWVNVVVGFELHYRSTFNWLLEYHGMDAFRRNRIYVGLTSRTLPATVSSPATSPVELLLLAAATCSASDVVLILQKQRVALRALEVTLHGTRRETEPRRYTAIHFRFAIAGEGADDAKTRRAIDLSLEKYCSVVASLAPDTRITYDVALR